MATDFFSAESDARRPGAATDASLVAPAYGARAVRVEA
jgi:hypothetical protein